MESLSADASVGKSSKLFFQSSSKHSILNQKQSNLHNMFSIKITLNCGMDLKQLCSSLLSFPLPHLICLHDYNKSLASAPQTPKNNLKASKINLTERENKKSISQQSHKKSFSSP
jgi:hypothetical protein